MADLVPHVDGLVYGSHFRHNFDYYPNASATVPAGGRPWILVIPLELEFNQGGRLSVRDESDSGYGKRAWYDFIAYMEDSANNDPPFDIFVCDIPWNRNNPQNVAWDAEKGYERSTVDYWPINVESAGLCFQYIRQHAADFANFSRGYALNPDSGAYAGWSAGGIVALLNSYRPSLPYNDPEEAKTGVAPQGSYNPYTVSSKPAWCLNRSGIHDLRASYYNNSNSVQGILGTAVLQDVDNESQLLEISASEFVDALTPPTIIVQDDTGTGNTSPPYQDPHHPNIGLDLQAILNAAGVTNSYTTTTDGNAPMDNAAIAACHAFGKSVLGL